MTSTKSMKEKGLALLPAGELIAFLLCCFLYFWLYINPALHYVAQEPIFFFSGTFLGDFLAYPGGLVEYFAAFLSQFYYYPAAGALVLALVCVLGSVAAILLFSAFKPVKANPAFFVIPGILLLGLGSIYSFNLSYNIGFVITLFLFALYLKSTQWLPVLRWLWFIIIAVVDYYLAAGFLILFLLLYIAYIIFNYKNPLDIVAVLVIIPIPWITAQYLAYISFHDACYYLLPKEPFSTAAVFALLLWIFILAVMVTGWLLKRKAGDDAEEKFIINLQNKTLVNLIQGGALLVIIVVTLMYSVNPRAKRYLTTDNLARHNKWQQLLDLQAESTKINYYEIFEINRALFHTGKLLDEMFTYPQNWGADGLFLSKQFSELTLLHDSDLAYDLGYYNESLHWAYEAISIKGETGWTLQRLANLHMLKGEKSSARRCLYNLQNTLQFKGWANHYLKILDNDSLLREDPVLKEKFDRVIDHDFMNYKDSPETNLLNLLQYDPENKMAFEYFMATCLLNRQWDAIVKNIPVFKQLGYDNLPKHIQEAILIYMAQNRVGTLDVSGYSMNIKVKAQFSAFQQLMTRFRNKEAAQKSMSETFRQSYWYYALYPPRQQSNEAKSK